MNFQVLKKYRICFISITVILVWGWWASNIGIYLRVKTDRQWVSEWASGNVYIIKICLFIRSYKILRNMAEGHWLDWTLLPVWSMSNDNYVCSMTITKTWRISEDVPDRNLSICSFATTELKPYTHWTHKTLLFPSIHVKILYLMLGLTCYKHQSYQ